MTEMIPDVCTLLPENHAILDVNAYVTPHEGGERTDCGVCSMHAEGHWRVGMLVG